MAVRAAATHPATRTPGAATGLAAATLTALAGAANTCPSAVLPPVPSLARPATDTPVNEPDAAQTSASCRQHGPARGVLRRAPVQELSASCCRATVRPATGTCGLAVCVVPGSARSGVVGCSLVPVRTVTGTRSRLDRFR